MFSGIKDLTERYSALKGITKKEAEDRVKDLIEVLRAELLDKSKDGIQFIDFITLKKKQRAAKKGRNPREPEKLYDIPAKIGIKAEVGKGFDKLLNPAPKKKKSKKV